jgi:gamma-tubulin complex component 5
VAHLSPLSYRSLLSSFANTATYLQQTRYLVQSIYDLRLKPVVQFNVPSATHCRTLEALAESLDGFVRGVERWCAEREEELFHSQRGHGKQLVISLLGFESSLRQRMAGVLEVVDAVLRKITCRAAAASVVPTNDGPSPIHANDFTFYHPSILSTLILDGLFAAIREQLSMGETATSQELLSILTHTAQPIWSSIGRWLRDGMDAVEDEEIHGNLMQDEELFIEKGDVPLGSPDFWDEGYRLRKVAEHADHSTPAQRDAIPAVFQVIAQDVLAAGKEVGLLRAMGLETPASFRMQEHKWLSFKQLYARSEENASKEVELVVLALARERQILDGTAGMRWASDALVATVQDYAVSVCQKAHSQLLRVLREDCELSRHLSGMQALFLMRRGDILSEWCANVFAKVGLEVHMLLICLTNPRSTHRSGGATFTSLTARSKISWRLTRILELMPN